MSLLRSLAIAFSCFSTIPMPQFDWEDKSMRYMLCFFPFVGLVIGLALLAWWKITELASLGTILWAAGIALIPIAITGGIHLDGFADVIDAQSSHAAPERKREILKDPHTGAFAIIGIASYVLAYFALASELPCSWQAVALLGLGMMASRCSSGIATTGIPKSTDEGMVAHFQRSAEKRTVINVLAVELALVLVGALFINVIAGASLALVCAVGLAGVRAFALKSFGGMSGDISGFFLQVLELVMLACIVIVAKAVGL